MKDLILDLIPHAPHLGLYVAPSIPPDKLRNALHDFAPSMRADEVVALFDATYIGSAKDGAVFARDRFIFQNNDLQRPQEVRYAEIVRVEEKQGFLKGAKIYLEVNRGRATFELVLDVSGKPKAMEFLARLLHEALLAPDEDLSAPLPEGYTPAGSDLAAVRQALASLQAKGLLADADYQRLLDVLRGG